MEPTLPTPHGSPEVGPPVVSPELTSPKGAEVQSAPEKHVSREQKISSDGGGQPAVQPVAQPPVTPVAMPAAPKAAAPQPPVVNDLPLTAADDDLIEKEWVEKAKQVIAQNRHDPYMQEQAVSRLQADYLQKRYGKIVKLPEEG